MKDQPLEIAVVKGRLVISIGVETLKYCHNAIENEKDADIGCGFNIVDATGFAKDVVQQLKHEQEDGTTPVHLLLDQVIQDAADNGSIHTKATKTTTL